MRSSVTAPIFQSASGSTLFLESLRSTMESDTRLILFNDGSPGADIGELIDDYARRIKADHGGAVTVATIHNKSPRGCGQALNQGRGVRAGTAAGARCVAVPHVLSRSHDLTAADIRFGSMVLCDLDALLPSLP